MDYKKYIAEKINVEGLSKEDVEQAIAVPPNTEMGDYALPCFKLAKVLRKAPALIAQQLAEQYVCDGVIESAEALNGYVNFKINKKGLACEVLNEIIAKGDRYGSSDIGAGKTICIDYSSVNIAKPFHIGHLSTTVIGGSLYKLFKFLGYNTVGINHLGDYGTQFGKLIITLVQKSVNVILSECDLPKTEFNALDFKLCGTMSDAVEEKSHGFYLSQNDPKYNDIPYSAGSITTSGCGPTALAMALNYAADEVLTAPETVASWATENGMVEPSVGTNWELFRTYPMQVGMSVTEKYASDADALESAMSGCKAMVTSMKQGDFTDNGHIIVIIGVENGRVEVLDPASIYRSTITWSVDTILEQSNNYYWCIN